MMNILEMTEQQLETRLFAYPVDIAAAVRLMDASGNSDPDNEAFAEIVKQCPSDPDFTITGEIAAEFTLVMTRWAAVVTERKKAEIASAFDKARRLIDELGDEHPEALQAVIHAIELQDPGICRREAAKCGLNLPEATHCSEDGAPLYTSTAIAEALGVSHEEIVERIEDLGLAAGSSSPAHRLQ